MLANLNIPLFEFAMRAQRAYSETGWRRHHGRRFKMYVTTPKNAIYEPSERRISTILLRDLDVTNPSSWQALSLFCYNRRASLLSVLLAEAGFLSIRDMVMFQALCVAPLLPSTVWKHVRACAELDFLSVFTGMPYDLIQPTLDRLENVGVIGPQPPLSHKRINKGITIRPVAIYNAVADRLDEDEMDPRWITETAMLAAMHSKEFGSKDFKAFQASIGVNANDDIQEQSAGEVSRPNGSAAKGSRSQTKRRAKRLRASAVRSHDEPDRLDVG